MNPNLLTSSGFHISLNIGQHLWTDLFSEALPVQVAGGKFSVNEQLRPVIAMLGDQMGHQVRQLAARTPPLLAPPVEHLRDRFGDRVQNRLRQLRRQVGDLAKIEGDWTLHVTREGSRFSYSPGAITVSARIRAVFDGTLDLGKGRRVLPIKLERFVRGTFTLGNLRYDKNKGGLIGGIRDLHLELGEHPLIKTGEVWIDRLLDKKLSRFKEVTLLQVGQINQSLEQSLGQLRFLASIDDVAVEINDSNLLLQVNFLFKQKSETVRF